MELRAWWRRVIVPGLRDLRLFVQSQPGIPSNTERKGGSQLKVVKVIEQRKMLRRASWKWGLVSSQLQGRHVQPGPLGRRCSSTSRNVTQHVCR